VIGRRFTATSGGATTVEIHGKQALVLRQGTLDGDLQFITLQTPEGTPLGTASVQVIRDGHRSPAAEAAMLSPSPRIAVDHENGRARILRSGGQPLGPCTGSMFGWLCPAVFTGEHISLFATGLGTSSPLTDNGLTVAIGNVRANVTWAGLAPGLPGVYQVNVRIPEVTGLLDMYIISDGRTSGPAKLNVQRP
jgi:uncharacterized protein (TIGR03437 family)